MICGQFLTTNKWHGARDGVSYVADAITKVCLCFPSNESVYVELCLLCAATRAGRGREEN